LEAPCVELFEQSAMALLSSASEKKRDAQARENPGCAMSTPASNLGLALGLRAEPG